MVVLDVLYLAAVRFLRLFGGISVRSHAFLGVDILRVNTFSILAEAVLRNWLRLWVNLVIGIVIVVG